MPENTDPVGGQEHKDPVGGAPDPKDSPQQPFKAFATEADLAEYDKKRSEKNERELKKLRMELDTLKESSLTEDQQKAEVQRKTLEMERAKIMEEADRRASFIGIGVSQGLTRDQATKWYSLAGDEWVDPQEAFASVSKDLGWTPPSNNSGRQVAGGGGRNADASGEERFTSEYVEEMIFKHGSKWYVPRKAKIEAWQAANMDSPIRRLS